MGARQVPGGVGGRLGGSARATAGCAGPARSRSPRCTPAGRAPAARPTRPPPARARAPVGARVGARQAPARVRSAAAAPAPAAPRAPATAALVAGLAAALPRAGAVCSGAGAPCTPQPLPRQGPPGRAGAHARGRGRRRALARACLERAVARVGGRLVALQDGAPRQRGPAPLAQHAPQLVRRHLPAEQGSGSCVYRVGLGQALRALHHAGSSCLAQAWPCSACVHPPGVHVGRLGCLVTQHARAQPALPRIVGAPKPVSAYAAQERAAAGRRGERASRLVWRSRASHRWGRCAMGTGASAPAGFWWIASRACRAQVWD